jgi:ABC-type Fe3+/spermidine/putrescine transport system ATPase subunit/ABC-type sulfate transport system permease component
VRRWASSPLPWLGGLLALYLLAPIVAFVVRLDKGVSAAPGVGGALATSLLTATISAAVIALLGTPLAYVLSRMRGPLGRLLTALVALPLALPPLIGGLLLLYVLGPRTELGELFDHRLTETRLGIVLAQTFVAAPFLVIAARAAFASVDPAFEDVAASLGHGRLARFWRVAVPAALPGIGAGLLLAWLRSFGEFGATVIVAYHPYSLPVFTYVQFDETGLPATVLPIALALGSALAVLLLVNVRLPRRRRAYKAVTASGPPASACATDARLDFSLTKRLGEFTLAISHSARTPRIALLGASGAGKTLTLRLLSGLTRPAAGGRVMVGRRSLLELPAERREIGYVPQQPALLPWRTVWAQVNFGVAADPALAAWWIERLGLAGLEDRYPHELSGGQQRRVALARALAITPRVLLLDEPFSGLDAPVRDDLRRELRRLQREQGLSTVLVTHDAEEAALLAEEIVVLDDGRVLQAGARESVFEAPSSPRVAALLGIGNTHRGVVLTPRQISCEQAALEVGTHGLPPGSDVVFSIRPERIAIDAAGSYEAVVLDVADLGAARELTIALDGTLELRLRTLERIEPRAGEAVRVAIDPAAIALWPAAHGAKPFS